jgi:uncharacterized protein with HEPN domain
LRELRDTLRTILKKTLWRIFGVDLDLDWEVVEKNLPELIRKD